MKTVKDNMLMPLHRGSRLVFYKDGNIMMVARVHRAVDRHSIDTNERSMGGVKGLIECTV